MRPVSCRAGAVAAAAVLTIASAAVISASVRPNAPTLLGQTLDEFASRRAQLRQAAGDAIVLITSGRPQDDRTRYRAANEIVYLTGSEAPGASLALLPDGDPVGHTEILFAPGRSSAEAEGQRTGIVATRSTMEMWDTLRPSVERARRIYIVGPVGERSRFQPSGQTQDRIKGINPDAEVLDVRPLIARLRIVKSAGEIANLREAIGATIAGFMQAARSIRPGVSELAIEGYTLLGFRQAGAMREGFPAVIGAGPNSVNIHNDPASRLVQKGETVVVDIGAEINYYTADLTRTFPVGGRFSPRQRALYDLILSVQDACAKRVTAGKTTWSDLESFAREHFRQSPLRAEGRNGEMLTMDRFFTHGLGHGLGLDVHDVGIGGPLPVGSVITIEPGLYIPSESIGIRIEDDYLVTEHGAEKLSAALPSEATAIERMMRGR